MTVAQPHLNLRVMKTMSDQIFIGKQEFRDQRERMVEEWDVSEEEAKEAFKNVKTQVMMASQDLDKDWSDETVEAVTNLVMGIQQQQYQNSQRNKSHFYDRLFRFLTGTTQLTAAAISGYAFFSGNVFVGVIFGAIAAATVIQQLRQ